MIVSPCINICKSDPITEFCYSCVRNFKEKLKWKDRDTSDNWKLKNLTDMINLIIIFTLKFKMDF